jgi:hypothetical protein
MATLTGKDVKEVIGEGVRAYLMGVGAVALIALVAVVIVILTK